MKFVDMLTVYCKKRGYVSEDQIPWLRYTIEKRLSSLFICVTLLVIGAYIASPIAAISFNFSFFYLRERTNGLHAKTFAECFFWSIISEVVILGVLFKRLELWVALLLLLISSIIIVLFAPFDHPSMHYSSEEIMACAVSSRKRLLILVIVVICGYILKSADLLYGITLGISMTAIMLVGARITLRRGKDE